MYLWVRSQKYTYTGIQARKITKQVCTYIRYMLYAMEIIFMYIFLRFFFNDANRRQWAQ